MPFYPPDHYSSREERFQNADKAYFFALAKYTEWFLIRGRLDTPYLEECSCPSSGAHNRFLWGNTRTKMENQIIYYVKQNFSGKAIRLLSLGAGYFLQDLILVAKLVEAGIRTLYLTLVEPDEDAEYPYQDYSERKLPGRTRDFIGTYCKGFPGTNAYLAVIDLIKSVNLIASTQNVLILMSRGREIISLTPKTAPSYFDEYKTLSHLDCALERVSLFYLNADIGNLPINLDYFIQAKKPLWINQAILREADRDSVAKFLEYYKIDYEFVEDVIARARFEEIKGAVLIVDCTIFDKKRGESAISESDLKPNLSVIRIDYSKLQPKKIPMEVYPPLIATHKHILILWLNNLSADVHKSELEETCSIRRYWVFTQITCFKDYAGQLIQNDDLKAAKVLEALDSGDHSALKLALGIRRHTWDFFGNTTGEKILESLQQKNYFR